jgi:hypothetical protein
MLIIWRGYGWLVPVVVFAAFILSQLSVDAMYGEGYYKANSWPKHMGTISGAILVGALGYFLNHVRRTYLVDEETGELAGKAPSHSLFFIPIEYWSIITLALFFWVTL